MNTLPKTALVALVAGTIGLTAAVPATFAQDAPKPPAQHRMLDGGKDHPRFMHRHGMQRHGMPGHGAQRGPMAQPGMGPMAMGGGLVNLACSPRGAEALEISFVRLAYSIDLTDQQKPLLDDLKTAALAAQKDFAETCQAAMPKRGATPDPLASYKARVAVESAHVDALNSVMPKFEAFIGSLDDGQKAKLVPHRPHHDRGAMKGMRGGPAAKPDAAAQPGTPDAPPPAPATEPAPPSNVQG